MGYICVNTGVNYVLTPHRIIFLRSYSGSTGVNIIKLLKKVRFPG